MNKIGQLRIGYDGVFYTKEKIEKAFLGNNLVDDICYRLNAIPNMSADESRVVAILTEHLKDILLMSPADMESYIVRLSGKKLYKLLLNSKGNSRETTFKSELLRAFGYNNYRKSRLVTLAKMLNVKSCPYCNMQYTLFAKENTGKKNRLARFQYDHFFDKVNYPMFSMSLYNLIPSCAVCNQGKSTKQLSLRFHPYVADINKQFHFEICDVEEIGFGEVIKDEMKVSLIPDNGCSASDLQDFDDTFHLSTLYSRHKDVAQEVFDKAYMTPYYTTEENFSFLGAGDRKYIERLFAGTYTDSIDIEKRPMTKFSQDIMTQAEKMLLIRKGVKIP